MDSLERSWYNLLAGHDIIPAPNIADWNWQDIEYDALVMTGGGDSVARHFTENRLYEVTKARGLPIIGFCHGAFAINDLAGGVNGHIDGHVGEDHIITMAGEIHTVNSFHSQNIAVLAPGFEVLAQDGQGWPEAFRHVFQPIWAVVWHPERQGQPVLPRELADLLRTPSSPF